MPYAYCFQQWSNLKFKLNKNVIFGFFSYDGVPLLQDLVVLAQGRQEDQRGDVFETVDPLPALRLLTSHVHDPEGRETRSVFQNGPAATPPRRRPSPQRDGLDGEGVVVDACGGESHPQHVLLRGDVVQGGDPVQVVHVAEAGEGRKVRFEGRRWRNETAIKGPERPADTRPRTGGGFIAATDGRCNQFMLTARLLSSSQHNDPSCWVNTGRTTGGGVSGPREVN